MSQSASHLFIVSYLDEDVEVELASALQKKAYEAYTVQDVGRRGMTDEQQLSFAAERSWTIVTHNSGHFIKLHNEWLNRHKEHAGIIVSKQTEFGRTLRALLNLLNQVSTDQARNQLFHLHNFE